MISTYSSSDDKNCVLLLTMLSLQQVSKILKDTEQTRILLTNSFRTLLRGVVERSHGKSNVDALMLIYDSAAWKPYRGPFCTRSATHPKFPQEPDTKPTTRQDPVESTEADIHLQRRAQLEASIEVLNAQMNSHACTCINRYLDDMLAERFSIHEDPFSLLKAIKTLFVSPVAEGVKRQLLAHLINRAKFSDEISVHLHNFFKSGSSLNDEHRDEVITSILNALTLYTPFTQCVTLPALREAHNTWTKSKSTSIFDLLAAINKLERENDRMFTDQGGDSKFPSPSSAPKTENNPFDSTAVLASQKFDLNLVSPGLRERRGGGDKQPQAKDPGLPLKRQPPSDSAPSGDYFIGVKDGRRRCSLCTSLQCPGATKCTGTYDLDLNHLGESRRKALELLPPLVVEKSKAAARAAGTAAPRSGTPPARGSAAAPSWQHGNVAQSVFPNTDNAASAGDMYFSVSSSTVTADVSGASGTVSPPSPALPLPEPPALPLFPNPQAPSWRPLPTSYGSMAPPSQDLVPAVQARALPASESGAPPANNRQDLVPAQAPPVSRAPPTVYTCQDPVPASQQAPPAWAPPTTTFDNCQDLAPEHSRALPPNSCQAPPASLPLFSSVSQVQVQVQVPAEDDELCTLNCTICADEDSLSRCPSLLGETTSASAVTQTAPTPRSRTYAAVAASASPKPILDSGCAPKHCLASCDPTSTLTAGISGTTQLRSATGTFTVPTVTGKGSVTTMSRDGAKYNLALPGSSISSPSFDRTLISASTLTKHGHRVVIDNPDCHGVGGMLHTPDGVQIPLIVENGLYTLPTVPPPPSIPAQNFYSVLGDSAEATVSAAPENHDDLDAITFSPLPGSLPLPSLSVQHDFDRLDDLHKVYNFPGQARIRNIVSSMHPDDPARPDPASIPAWIKLHSCVPYRPRHTDDEIATALRNDFDLLDRLHASHGHPGQARMRLLLETLAREDPDAELPSSTSIPAWLRLRPCSACKLGGATRPPLRSTHPPLPASPISEAGAHISIDGSGAYPHTTLSGNNQSFFFVCRSTHVKWAFPTSSKDNATLLDTVLLFQSHSTVQLRSLRVDSELIGPELTRYCLSKGIKLTPCAPNTHSGNGVAERAVGLIKTASRICSKNACISTMLLDHAHVCAAQQLSATPSALPIFGKIQSPMSAWLFATGSPAPFLHSTLDMAPFGCLAHGHVGKVSSNPNTADRSRPGIFLNWDPIATGYRIFHSDRKSVMTYAHVSFTPTRFPYCEQYFAGERPGTQDIADLEWRKHSIYPIHRVDDESAANFLVGKQVQLSLHGLYPEYPHPWTAICHSIYRPQTTSLAEVIAMRLVFSGYSGSLSSLSPTDRIAATALSQHSADAVPLEIIVPVSPLRTGQHLPADDGRDHWYRPPRGSGIRPPNLRDLLKQNYPTARSLADIAHASAGLAIYYPVHDAMMPPSQESLDTRDTALDSGSPADDQSSRQAPSTCTGPLPLKSALKRKTTRVVAPSRKIAGNIRSPRATWNPSISTIIPNRVRCRKTAEPVPSTAKDPGDNVPRRCSPRRAVPQSVFIVQSSPSGTHLGWEPRSVAEARKHPSWPLWAAAISKEINGLVARGIWTTVHVNDVPSHIRILPTKIVLKDKHVTGPKARLVVRGDLEDDRPSSDTYSATPTATEVRTVFALATQNGWKIHSLDVSQAFTQADPLGPDEEIYIRPPAGYDCEPGTVWKLNRPLYGLSIAPKCWTTTLQQFLIDYGFTKVNCSETYWKWSSPCGTQHINLVYWVDDILLSFNNDDAASAFKAAFLSRFDGTDDGPVTRFVGIDVTRSATQTHLSQEPLARDLLEQFGMSHCNAVLTPLEPGVHLLESDRPSEPDPELRRNYQVIVGTLQYLCTYTRPDLVFATNQLAKHMSNPGPVHMAHARRVLRYLKGTASLGITYTQDLPNPNGLLAWADADWCACTDTRRSYSGYCLMLNGGAVSWKSAQQTSVATSTAEAEFVSASKCSDEVLWLRRILADVGSPQLHPTPLMEDNRACRALSESPITSRSRHIDFRVMSLRERVADGVVKVYDCPTHDMLADPFTKNLPREPFERHRQVLLGQAPSSSPYIHISGPAAH